MILNMFINDACHCEEPEGRRSNLLKNNTRGFSLLEMTVVIIVATILATALIPQLIKGYSINAANKTALDISAIQEASRAYYVANNNWPANIAGQCANLS